MRLNWTFSDIFGHFEAIRNTFRRVWSIKTVFPVISERLTPMASKMTLFASLVLQYMVLVLQYIGKVVLVMAERCAGVCFFNLICKGERPLRIDLFFPF